MADKKASMLDKIGKAISGSDLKIKKMEEEEVMKAKKALAEAEAKKKKAKEEKKKKRKGQSDLDKLLEGGVDALLKKD